MDGWLSLMAFHHQIIIKLNPMNERNNTKQVTKAVIAVPAKFDARQKRATGEAYKRAGLKVCL